jgi:hypothetical protein
MHLILLALLVQMLPLQEIQEYQQLVLPRHLLRPLPQMAQPVIGLTHSNLF